MAYAPLGATAVAVPSTPTGIGIGATTPWFLSGELSFGEPVGGRSLSVVPSRVRSWSRVRKVGNYVALMCEETQSPPTTVE